MKVAIVLSLLLISIVGQWVHASEGHPYKLFYVNGERTELPASEAIIKSLNGEEIYKCQAVQAGVNKTGTSISLKNVKKPSKN